MDEIKIKEDLFKVYNLEIENDEIKKKRNSIFCLFKRKDELLKSENNNINKQKELYYPICLLIDEIRYDVILNSIGVKNPKYYEDALYIGFINYSIIECIYYTYNNKKYINSFDNFYEKVKKLLSKKDFEELWNNRSVTTGNVLNSFSTTEFNTKMKKYLESFPKKPIAKVVNNSYNNGVGDDGVYRPWEDDRYDDSYGAWLDKGGPYKESDDYDGAFDPFDGGDFF